MFDPEVFVSECQAARTTADPVGAVGKVVGTTIADGGAIDAVLGAALTGEEQALFSSEDLTVQRILWPGGMFTPPHEHRMWAVIGVYRGEELNRFYERTPQGLKECGQRAVGRGDVLVLDSDTIHSVENPHHEITGGVHVYGGDIRGIDRSAWGPDGREVPFSQLSPSYRSMFQPMRDLAHEHGTPVRDDARYDAFLALRAACEREGRYPTYSEARRIIADTLGVSA